MAKTDLAPQDVSLHTLSHYDCQGGATVGGKDIVLTNLAAEIRSGDAVTAAEDADPTDDSFELDTAGSEGQTAQVYFTAKGDDGKDYEALVNVTLVGPEVSVGLMAITFTEKA